MAMATAYMAVTTPDGMYVHSSLLPDSCSGILRQGKYLQGFILTLVHRRVGSVCMWLAAF